MELILNLMSTSIVTFWFIIWLMHLCAMFQARLKLKNQNHSTNQDQNIKQFNVNNNNYNNNNYIVGSREDVLNKQQILSKFSHLIIPSAGYCPDKSIQDSSDNHYSSHLRLYGNNNNSSSNRMNTKLCDNNSNLFYYTTNISSANQRTHQGNMNDHCLTLPGVSILKPLLGVDSNLRSNLETFFHMNYPLYEVLFCVQDKDDEAIPLVEQLLKQYPEQGIKLFIGNGTRVGVNPKINNMQPAYEACKYELILISDSGISMKQDTLLDMVNHMREDVALVHQMPFVLAGRTGFQSIVERVYFGTAHARAYLTADLLNINCPTGMSALMRKCLLDEVGGIKAFGQYLAEDFFFAKSFTDRGWKISISSQPAMQNPANSGDTISTLSSRIQRWIKLRFAMVPFWTLLEPISECMLLGLLSSVSMNYLWLINPYVVFVAHVMVWLLFDYKLLCLVQNGPLPCSKVEFALAWTLRECTALIIYLMALASPQVTWRSRTFRLRWGGCAEEIGHEASTTATVEVANCTVDPRPAPPAFNEELYDETEVERIDELIRQQQERQVLQLLDTEPANEFKQQGSWATKISTILNEDITPAIMEQQQHPHQQQKRQLDSRAAQNYDKSIRVECNEYDTSTMGTNQHHLLDMAILAHA